MTSVATINSRATAAVASLLNPSAPAPDAVLPGAAPASRDPLDALDLSDHAKFTLARAKSEQTAADSLTAQLQSGRGKASDTPAKGSAQAASYARVSTAFMSMAGLTDADLKPAYEPTVPMVSFTSSMQAFGFSISATGNANSWSSDIQIRGPGGLSAWDTIWGGGKGNPTAGGGGVSGLTGQQFMARKENGKVYFTISDFSATAAAVTTDKASASAATAHFDATTFIVDFRTGGISVERTDMSAAMLSVAAK